MSTIVVITGSKTGIGKGFLSSYASRSDTTVIAAIRDGPDSEVAKSLESIAVGKGSKVIVAEYDASSHKAGEELVTYLQKNHNINHLDIVVANAGILNNHSPVADVTPEIMLEHFSINSLAPLLLYKATSGLLKASKGTPKFFIISSTLGSNALVEQYQHLTTIAYNTSKAAVNIIAGNINKEDPRIAVIPVHPGWVQTAMGERAAKSVGMSMSDVPVTIEQSVTGLTKFFDVATKEQHGGKFFDFNSETVPW